MRWDAPEEQPEPEPWHWDSGAEADKTPKERCCKWLGSAMESKCAMVCYGFVIGFATAVAIAAEIAP